jgi:hypothetical protein
MTLAEACKKSQISQNQFFHYFESVREVFDYDPGCVPRKRFGNDIRDPKFMQMYYVGTASTFTPSWGPAGVGKSTKTTPKKTKKSKKAAASLSGSVVKQYGGQVVALLTIEQLEKIITLEE